MEIRYTETAIADLEKLTPRTAAQVLRKIDRLRLGLHGDIKHLTNYDYDYRLRSGNFRILFDVSGNHIIVHRIKDRKEAYD